jgi:Cu2+-containing amine oxidase
MNQVLHISLRMRGLLATPLAALALAAPPLVSQAQDEAIRREEHVHQALQPLTAAEIQQATTVLQSDDRVRTRFARSPRVQTVLVERHEEDKDAPTGQRRADVVLYSYDTNESISAVVTLRPTPRVEHLTVTRNQPPGLSTEEVEEAQQLALAHPTVQAGLRAAGLDGRESELIITHMRVQTAAPGDPCSTHRCAVLFFNTRDAVLDIEPIVDLTTREVEVQ